MPLILLTYVCNYRIKIHITWGLWVSEKKNMPFQREVENPTIMQQLVFGWYQMWMG